MEVEEVFRVFESAVAHPRGVGVAGVMGRVRREYERVRGVGAQRAGSADGFVMVVRRAQLEVRLLYQGWRPWMARVVAECWPRRWLPPVLTHEM